MGVFSSPRLVKTTRLCGGREIGQDRKKENQKNTQEIFSGITNP